MILIKKDIKHVSVSHIRCDGTVNVALELNDGTFIDLYCLSLKQADSIENGHWSTIKVDPRMLTRTFEQECQQNGVN